MRKVLLVGIALLIGGTACGPGGDEKDQQTSKGGDTSEVVAPSVKEVGEGIPPAPTDMLAIALSETEIMLAWADNSTNEEGFAVERKSDGEFEIIATLSADETQFIDSGLSASTGYVYRVTAFNSAGASATGDEIGITTLNVAIALPAAPSELVAEALSATEIHLKWRDNSTDEKGFRVERKLAGSGYFKVIATLAVNVREFHDTKLIPGTQYTYRVTAFNDGGTSQASNEASASTKDGALPPPPPPPPPAGLAPAAPTKLVATATSTSSIALDWVDNSSNETGFKIERKTGAGGTYSVIATLGANVISFDDNGRSASTQYFYRVWAFNAAGDSAKSNEAGAKTNDNAVVVSFAAQVHPMLMAKCAGCHGASSFTALKLTGSSASDYPVVVSLVNTGAPASSAILQKPTGTPFHGGGTIFGVGSESYNSILSWIQGGLAK